MAKGRAYPTEELRINPPQYDKKHPTFDFPQIRGNTIVFNESGTSDRIEEEERELRPLTLEHVSEEDFTWLQTAVGELTIDCGYQGISKQGYDLVRNAKTGEVALKWQGMLVIDPVDLLRSYFYDGITHEVERLKRALEGHQEGERTGWGDEQIDDRYLPTKQSRTAAD